MKAIFAAVLCALATLPAAAVKQVEPFVYTFDDIKYWVGDGTNRCAVVIDFNDGSVANSSFAWGYRWNGDAPDMKTILDEIAADDPRFASFITSSGWVNGFGYDVDDDGGTFTTGKTYTKSDDDDLFPQAWYDFDDESMYGDDWAISSASGAEFGALEWTKSATVSTGMFPLDGQWCLCRFSPYAMDMMDFSYVVDEYEPTATPLAATRTFRLGDIEYWIGSGTNVAGIAVSWGAGKTRAWGYRWNGEAPVLKQVLQEISAADGRLVPHYTRMGTYDFLDTFGYDGGDVGGVTYDWNNYTASDVSAWIAPYLTDYVDPEDYNTWIYHYFNLVSEPDEFFRTGASAYDTSWLGVGEYCLSAGGWTILAYNEDNFLTTLDPSIASATPSRFIVNALPVVGGATYASLEAAFDSARGGGSVTLPEQASINTATKTVTVGRAEDETLQVYEVPAHFDMAVSGGTVSLTLNAVATPTLTATGTEEEPPFTVTDDKVTLVPGNVIDGLYYGLAVSTNLTEGFSAPTEWVRAENGKVVLEKAKNAAATGEFYKVRVSDVDELAK